MKNDNLICKECGKEVGSAIQWTHLKYKCSGKINSIKEYKSKFPNSPIKSKSLLKKTAITKENMVKKYGKDEGEVRWKQYCSKQSESNSFEYKQRKYGWSKDQFDKFNLSRAVTIENLISKYGEQLGIKKFNDYCEKQRISNSEEYFIKKYGDKLGSKKYWNFHERRIIGSINSAKSQLNKNSSQLEINCFNWLKEFLPKINQQIILPNLMFNLKFNAYDYGLDKKLLEFNGTWWHVDPRFYEDDYFHPLMKKTAKHVVFLWMRWDAVIFSVILGRYE